MVFPQWQLGLFSMLLVLGLDAVQALSPPPRPIWSFEHPTTRSLDIFPRHQSSSLHSKRTVDSNSAALRHDDAFRLIFSAFGDEFHLHLRPNEHLIHPAARIVYHNNDGSVSRTKPLLRESIKAYHGHVVDPEFSDARIREDTARVINSAYPEAERGWARIVVHDAGDTQVNRPPVFEGAFMAGGNIHHVVTKDNYFRNKHPLDPSMAVQLNGVDSGLIIWRDSDIMSPEEELAGRPSAKPANSAGCGHDKLPYNGDPLRNPALGESVTSPWPDVFGSPTNVSLFKRDDIIGGDMGTNFIDSIGDNSGCPNEQQVLYMGVAADCVYVSAYGSQDNATQQILTNWNTASSTFKNTFNVSLGIVELQVQEPQCPSTPDPDFPWNVACSDDMELNDRLSTFSTWRGQREDTAGLYHLMSGCPTGSEVGVAWLGTLCQQITTGSTGQFVSGTGVSTNGRTEWQIIVHEIGHNFGAIHDCADSCDLDDVCCPLRSNSCNAEGLFLMSPVSSASGNTFSECSLGNVCSLLAGRGGNVDSSCLVNANEVGTTIALKMCGNGIVEEGEQCDPGFGVTSRCCDSSTCRFAEDAVCDPDSSTCCTDQCSFAPSTQVCRPARDDRCDTAETCSGTDSKCPDNKYSPNGQSCGDDNLACANGACTSVELQCQQAGSALNLSQACSSSSDSCQITCQDPTQSNQCIQLNSMLVDGSPCGFGGTCSTGKCQSAGALQTALSWYKQNLAIAIPVTVVVGIILLSILYCILRSLWRCLSGSRGRAPAAVAAAATTPSYGRLTHDRSESYHSRAGLTSNSGPYASSQPPDGWAQPVNQTHWVDTSAYNGPNNR